VTDELFDETSIRASFVAIASRLEELDAPAGVLIVVGGSFMAVHGLRESTYDIDTVNSRGLDTAIAARLARSELGRRTVGRGAPARDRATPRAQNQLLTNRSTRLRRSRCHQRTSPARL